MRKKALENKLKEKEQLGNLIRRRRSLRLFVCCIFDHIINGSHSSPFSFDDYTQFGAFKTALNMRFRIVRPYIYLVDIIDLDFTIELLTTY